ncbi:hypothetical protein BKA70DRAFT_1225827 [Coprinopsis sp. MPI-PUGE-AT-0042]|nr:hypothetical protein BKA70DRAFT_1225827 [Coprinopsis sp. MPI-PUGE-AT-0042]
MSGSTEPAFRHASVTALLEEVNRALTSPPGCGTRQILHFDSAERKLVVWYWPVYDAGDEVVIKESSRLYTRVVPCNLVEYRQQHHFRAPCCFIRFVSTPSLDGNDAVLVCLDNLYSTLGVRVRKYKRRALEESGRADFGQSEVSLTQKHGRSNSELGLDRACQMRLQQLGQGGLSEAHFMQAFMARVCALLRERQQHNHPQAIDLIAEDSV